MENFFEKIVRCNHVNPTNKTTNTKKILKIEDLQKTTTKLLCKKPLVEICLRIRHAERRERQPRVKTASGCSGLN